MSNRPRAQRRAHGVTSTTPMERAFRRFERDTLPLIPTDRLGVPNVYACGSCNANTVTVDRVAGTTPMFLRCPSCGAMAASSMYPRAAAQLEPTFEWYRPELGEFLRMGPEMRAHVLNGGLALRPLQLPWQDIVRSVDGIDEADIEKMEQLKAVES